MEDVKSVAAERDVSENLALARRAANRGDTSHTVLYAQEAVCLSIEVLMREIAALRSELRSTTGVKNGASALAD